LFFQHHLMLPIIEVNTRTIGFGRSGYHLGHIFQTGVERNNADTKRGAGFFNTEQGEQENKKECQQG